MASGQVLKNNQQVCTHTANDNHLMTMWPNRNYEMLSVVPIVISEILMNIQQRVLCKSNWVNGESCKCLNAQYDDQLIVTEEYFHFL